MRSSTPAFAALFAAVALITAGCEPDPDPVPDDKDDYVGVWKSENGSYVQIDESGICKYKWKDGSTTTELAKGAASWKDDTFLCTWFLFESDFSVEQPPRRADGRWEMKMDGKRLVRQD